MNSARTRYGQVWTLSGRSAAPEVEDHQDRGDDGDEDAVQDVEAKQRRRSHHRPRREQRASVVARRHSQLRAERTFVAEQGRGPRHVRADRHRPDCQLIPGEQVAGEREQEREGEQVDADDPVELPGRLVTAGHEDPEHVQPDEDDHAVRRPAVHVAHDHSEGNVEVEVLDVPVRVLAGGPVVEHQHHAGHHRAEIEKEGEPAGAPGMAVADPVPPHLRGMQMQPDVGADLQHAVARGVRVAVAEDRSPDVVVGDDLAERCPALLGFGHVQAPLYLTNAFGSSHWPSSYR